MSGGAQGLRAWMLQRFTAVYLGLFILYFVGALVFCPPADYGAWRDWIGAPVTNLASALFFLALALHAWVGIRDVLLDYIKPAAVRVAALAMVGVTLAICLLWAGRVLVLVAY